MPDRSVLLMPATALLLGACSAANLNFAEVERDLDSIVQLEGPVGSERLVFRDRAEVSAWYARATLLVPIRSLLIVLFGPTVERKIDSPSGAVRDLLIELAPKAGDDPLRVASALQRLVRIAELDPSALNRLHALDGLTTLANARGIDMLDGVMQGLDAAAANARLERLLQEFRDLRPAGRKSAVRDLAPLLASRYATVLDELSELPLGSWQQRVGLVADLAVARRDETMRELWPPTETALQRAFGHAIRWTIVRALQGRSPSWVEVRRGAIDIVHRAGGPGAVPLLLALLSNSPERIAEGESRYDTDPMIQLRLIHLCGQLDQERARLSVRLPGRDSWQAVSPLDFLAMIALSEESDMLALRLPATEALALCLGRRHIGLAEVPLEGSGDADWVRTWYEDYRRSS